MIKPTFGAQLDKLKRAYYDINYNPNCPCHNVVGWLMRNDPTWMNGVKFIENDNLIVPMPRMESEVDLQKTVDLFSDNSGGLYTLTDLLKVAAVEVNAYIKTLLSTMDIETAVHEALCQAMNELKEVHCRKGQNALYEPINKRDYEYEEVEIIEIITGPIMPRASQN